MRADVEDARQVLRQGSGNGARSKSARTPTESAHKQTDSDNSTATLGPLPKAGPRSITPVWGLKLVDHYSWIADVADEPIDLAVFDARSRTAFRRGHIRTWGELGGQTNDSLHTIPGIGDLTVRRINQVLTAHGPVVQERLAIDAMQRQTVSKREHGSAPPNFNLRIAIEWASAHTDDQTLAGLLRVYDRGVEIPANVADEMETLLATPLSRLTDHEVPQLGELIEELLSQAKDPELLASREFSQVRPTLAELGRDQGVSRERVRQKVAKDAKHLRKLLVCERFQTVRWAVGRLQAEFGVAIPTDSEPVKRWETRLGDRQSKALRWLAGYVYDGNWIYRGKGGRSHLARMLGNLVGDEWLISTEDLLGGLDPSVNPSAAIGFFSESGRWRDIGDGWFVRWDGPIQAKAERVLRLTCRPMAPDDLIEAIGHGSATSLKNQYKPSLVRVDKQFRLALREWGYEEYEGITTEIEQRIDRGGGIASVSAMIEEFVSDFGVKEGSVRAYLEVGPYLISGDEVRRLANRGYTPSSVSGRQHAIPIREKWGQRFTVSDTNLKGYSFGLDRDIAAHNGLQPDDSLVVPATHSGSIVGEASLIWRLTNISGTVDVGRLSSVLKELGIDAGEEIVIVATPESCAVLRDSETPQQGRSAISADIRRSLLGRD